MQMPMRSGCHMVWAFHPYSMSQTCTLIGKTTQKDQKIKERFSGRSRCLWQRSYRCRKLLIRGLARRPEGKPILSIWSNGKDTQYKMPVGKTKMLSRSREVSRGSHGQESMNFCQGEYDAGASLASAQRQYHSTRESSSITSTWAITTDFRIHLHSALEFTFGATLEPVSNFTL
jgi:hypothetical protein